MKKAQNITRLLLLDRLWRCVGLVRVPRARGQVVSENIVVPSINMPSDGTKMIDAGWPMEIEFTDKYPGYYLEKLLHGEDWEKDLTASRL